MQRQYGQRMPTSPYLSVNMTHDTAKRLRRIVAELSLMRGRRVTNSEVIDAALDFAEHRPEAYESIQ
jgi:hypothetical protein